jgi:hypothetical protein
MQIPLPRSSLLIPQLFSAHHLLLFLSLSLSFSLSLAIKRFRDTKQLSVDRPIENATILTAVN